MATWVNLLDAIYPAGSVYLSRNATSPASIIGGSWTQIKGAVLAACGANSFTTNNYGGSLKISVNQMPSHQHYLGNSNIDSGNSNKSYKYNKNASGTFQSIDGDLMYGNGSDTSNWREGPLGALPTGGGKTFCLTTTQYTSGIELHKAGDLVWQLL